MDLSKVDTVHLRAELTRRELAVPQIKTIIDAEPLKKMMVGYVKEIMSEDYCDDNDWDHYIYETAIEMFYGKEFWDWYNKKVK